MRNSIIAEAIPALFIFLFLYTALDKILHLEAFRYTLSTAPWIGAVSGMLAISVPLAEMIAVCLLFRGRTRLAGLYTTALLMTGFAAYIALMMVFAPELPCNCGGVIASLTWPQHLVFNIFFLVLAIAGILITKQPAVKKEHPV